MTIQNYTTDLETSHLCDECMEAVTNPLCPFCLSEEINAWLTLYPDLRKTVMPQIRSYLTRVSNKITTYGTTCIKCKEKRAFVCPYCFTELVFEELEKINVPPLVLQEFMDFFNFDLGHNGYSKDWEEKEVL